MISEALDGGDVDIVVFFRFSSFVELLVEYPKQHCDQSAGL